MRGCLAPSWWNLVIFFFFFFFFFFCPLSCKFLSCNQSCDQLQLETSVIPFFFLSFFVFVFTFRNNHRCNLCSGLPFLLFFLFFFFLKGKGGMVFCFFVGCCCYCLFHCFLLLLELKQTRLRGGGGGGETGEVGGGLTLLQGQSAVFHVKARRYPKLSAPQWDTAGCDVRDPSCIWNLGTFVLVLVQVYF